MQRIFFAGLLAILFAGCNDRAPKEGHVQTTADTIAKPIPIPANAFKGTKVPVLCYHAIREIEKGDGPDQKAYSVSPENFALQMKTLHDNGYETVTPDQLRDFYTSKKPLPEKPIMISFDDGRKDQFTIAAPELEKYNFKGVFYIMTVSLGRKHYMERADVKALASRGHIIGSHTWDHHRVNKYEGDDWNLQIIKPQKQLEELTQKPITSFAYPNGVWSAAAADTLKNHGFTTAFLFGTKQDAERPLFTIERLSGPNISNMEKFIGRVEKITE